MKTFKEFIGEDIIVEASSIIKKAIDDTARTLIELKNTDLSDGMYDTDEGDEEEDERLRNLEIDYSSKNIKTIAKDLFKIIQIVDKGFKDKTSVEEMLNVDKLALWKIAMGPVLGHGVGVFDDPELSNYLENLGIDHKSFDKLNLWKQSKLDSTLDNLIPW